MSSADNHLNFYTSRIILLVFLITSGITSLHAQQKGLLQLGAGVGFGTHLQNTLEIDDDSPFLGPTFQFSYSTSTLMFVLGYGIEGGSLGGGYSFGEGKVQYPLIFTIWSRNLKTSDTNLDASVGGIKISYGRTQYITNRFLWNISAFAAFGGIAYDDESISDKNGFTFTPGITATLNFQIKTNNQ